MRRNASMILMVAVVTVLLVPQSALAGKPRSTCPPGFDLGALTLAEAIQLPNVLAALADGFADVASLTAGFEAFDSNDDGAICFKSYPSNADATSLLQYFYNVVDNKASVSSG